MSNSTHPLILTAAGAVIVASGVGIANMLGWVGTSNPAPAASAPISLVASTVASASPTPSPTPTASPSPSPTAKPTVAPTQAPKKKPIPTPTINHNTNKTEAPVAIPQVTAKAICYDCGQIASVQKIETEGEASPLGAVIGGVAGGVIGNQIGKGNGRTAARILGAIGGAVAGTQIEKQVKKTSFYEVTVNMDDGSTRSVRFEQQPDFGVGDKVKLNGDQLMHR